MATCPFADQSRRYDSRYGGRYTSGPYKGLLHTTETRSLPSYGSGASAPHFTILPDLGRRRMTYYQHYDTARPARALRNLSGGVQTNGDSVIQIELVGTCDPAYLRKYGGCILWPSAPTWALDGVKRLMVWLEDVHRIPAVSTSRPWVPYPRSYANGGGQRMGQSEWDRFAGWCGHQHVPENTHGDPGNINIGYLLDRGRSTVEDDDMPLSDADIVKIQAAVWAPAVGLEERRRNYGQMLQEIYHSSRSTQVLVAQLLGEIAKPVEGDDPLSEEEVAALAAAVAEAVPTEIADKVIEALGRRINTPQE